MAHCKNKEKYTDKQIDQILETDTYTAPEVQNLIRAYIKNEIFISNEYLRLVIERKWRSAVYTYEKINNS